MRVAVTQPPSGADDLASYRDWKRFVGAHRLPVDFEVGRKFPFDALLASARAVITTSVVEGFGLGFLESWTAGKPLAGRRLPEICRDIEENGVRLGHLYDRIDVPLGWIDARALSSRWRGAVIAAAGMYGFPFSAIGADAGFEALTREGLVDFGVLDEAAQREVLFRLLDRPWNRSELVERNSFLEPGRMLSDAEAVVEANRRIVSDVYGLKRYGQRLLDIYRRVLDRPVRHRVEKGRLLRAFFRLERFSMLHWGGYEG
jgi:glycosyltransferase involved in cell wall biosynthesis